MLQRRERKRGKKKEHRLKIVAQQKKKKNGCKKQKKTKGKRRTSHCRGAFIYLLNMSWLACPSFPPTLSRDVSQQSYCPPIKIHMVKRCASRKKLCPPRPAKSQSIYDRCDMMQTACLRAWTIRSSGGAHAAITRCCMDRTHSHGATASGAAATAAVAARRHPVAAAVATQATTTGAPPPPPGEGKDVVVVGIAGGSGSGKTIFAQNLQRMLTSGGTACVMVPHDMYYRNHDEVIAPLSLSLSPPPGSCALPSSARRYITLYMF